MACMFFGDRSGTRSISMLSVGLSGLTFLEVLGCSVKPMDINGTPMRAVAVSDECLEIMFRVALATEDLR